MYLIFIYIKISFRGIYGHTPPKLLNQFLWHFFYVNLLGMRKDCKIYFILLGDRVSLSKNVFSIFFYLALKTTCNPKFSHYYSHPHIFLLRF